MVSHVRGELGADRGHRRRSTSRIVTRSRIDVSIDARKIATRDDKRDEHLRSADFLDVANHPTVTFRSTRVERGAGGDLRVTGDLTIRGTTRPVTLTVESLAPAVADPWGNTKRGATAHAKINRKDWGLEWNVASRPAASWSAKRSRSSSRSSCSSTSSLGCSAMRDLFRLLAWWRKCGACSRDGASPVGFGGPRRKGATGAGTPGAAAARHRPRRPELDPGRHLPAVGYGPAVLHPPAAFGCECLLTKHSSSRCWRRFATVGSRRLSSGVSRRSCKERR